jgi:hypothetical protein
MTGQEKGDLLIQKIPQVIKKVILEYIDFEVIVPNKCSKIRFSGNYFSTL